MGELNIAVNYDLELYYDFFLRVDEYQNISFIWNEVYANVPKHSWEHL